MTPETEAFLARVREAEDPPAEVQARVLESVRAQVAASPGAAAVSGMPAALKLVVAIAGLAAASIVLQPAVAPEPEPEPVPVPASASSPPALVLEPEPASSPTPPPAPKEPVPPPSLSAELRLLSEVHAALRRGDPADALRLLDAYRTTDRRLRVERRAARVFALCAAGRTAEGQLAAAAFIRLHPGAPQRLAVERACASPSN